MNSRYVFSSTWRVSVLALAFTILAPLGPLSAAPQEKKPSEQKSAPETLKAPIAPEHIKKNRLEPYVEKALKWDKEVASLSANNAKDGSDDAILFLGSSSIRLWNSIEQDIAPWKPVRRGYGGSKYCDVALYTPQLIRGLKFQAAAVFVANDITGSELDKTPEEIARLAKIVVESIRSERPDAPVLLISITATPSRFKHWPRIEQANRALQRLSDELPGVSFLETQSAYLTPEGQPKPEYFVKDMLHQNADGYRVWGGLVRSKLNEIIAAKP
jgi:hypothetical protein